MVLLFKNNIFTEDQTGMDIGNPLQKEAFSDASLMATSRLNKKRMGEQAARPSFIDNALGRPDQKLDSLK